MFGLISLLITVALAALWLSGSLGGMTQAPVDENATTTRASVGAEYMMEDPFMNNPRPSYGEAIGGAKGAADTMGQ